MSDRSNRLPAEYAHILFMDIVGYSLLPTLNDQLRVNATLQAIVRNTEEFQRAQAEGNLISGDTGDGLALVFFRDPAAPVYCAVEIARALQDSPELPVRIGINSGLVSRTTDFNGHEKVSGDGINMAQRVMDCGDAGHILLSQACADLMRQFSEWLDALHDLGEYQIKHDRTLRLYNLYMEQVGNPAPPSRVPPKSAPAANTPTNAPGNAPTPVTSVTANPNAAARSEADTGSNTQHKTKINPIDNAEMTWIPAGTFQMGGNGEYDGKPVHAVSLSGFWMYTAPVTVAQFRKYCDGGGFRHDFGKDYDWIENKPSWGWIDEHPMVNVSWKEANAYARWASVTLPTEAQWEYAARGGLEGKNYPWGDAWDGSKCANSVFPNGLTGTKPAGSYPSNGYGLYDMAGNVWQWCTDWYDEDYYTTQAASSPNPPGTGSGALRVLRGGSWHGYYEANFRCAYRYFYYPASRGYISGFRCGSPGV